MSSWALTSFIKNCDDQPSGFNVVASIIETEAAPPFQADEVSIDQFGLAGVSTKLHKDEELRIKTTNTNEQKKGKQMLIDIELNERIANPKQRSTANEVLNQITGPSGSVTTTTKHARKMVDNRRDSAISPKN